MDARDRELIQELIDAQEATDKKLDRLVDAVLGNEYNPRGFKHRIEALEAYQRKDFILKIKIAAIWSGFLSAGTLLCWFFMQVLPKWLH